MLTIQLKNTLAEQDYNGCGWAWLVLKNDRPIKLLYHPEQQHEGMPQDWELTAKIAPEIIEDVEIWFGMASCYEFNAMIKIGGNL